MSDKTLELQIRIAAEEAARIVSALKGDMKGLADEAGKYAKGNGEALNKSFKDSEKAARDTVTSIGDIKRAIGSLAEVVTAVKALSVIKDMGTFALQTADNFQTARNQFGILLGDMQAGAGLFNEIKAFNDVTPFDLDTLTQATNVLISAKVPLQDLQNQLTKFGDLSQGNSQRLTSYIHAFSIAAAKGKADMQVLNTYLNQGVPILEALANNFNKTESEILEMSSNGKISFADFSRALDDLTSAGGQYFGGMELASRSLTAMQEGLNEAVNSLAASFGEMMLPAAIAVVGALTDITNAINESPIAKGIFAGALITLTGLLAAKAVQATIAFAAQMKLNFAIGALSPVVLASTIAVAALAAGYTVYTSELQKSKREAENAAYQQKKQTDAINSTTNAIHAFNDALSGMSDTQISRQIEFINSEIKALSENITTFARQAEESYRKGDITRARYFSDLISTEREQLNNASKSLEAALDTQSSRRTSWIDQIFDNTQAAKIQKINERLAVANRYLAGSDLSVNDRQRLQEIVRGLNEELAKLNNQVDINKIAADWKTAWAEVYKQFQADQANDPFHRIEQERIKKHADARANYLKELNQKTHDEIDEYYNAQRSEVIKQLAEEEARVQRELADEIGRIQRGLTRTRIDDIKHERLAALEAVDELEAKRIAAAEDSEQIIAAIRARSDQMREDTILYYKIEIDTATLEEARESVKNWQEELSDNLLRGMLSLESFSDSAAVIIADLSTQLAELSISAALSGFEEFGRALGQGEDAVESMGQALAAMGEQILKQLPMMFLQAGLQLIANGQWALGLGFIAAAGSTAIISGYVDGATEHAHGGVFDEYGQAARAYAAGGAFTNQIVSTPTYFAHGGGFGLMGEAGPEAIMPLTRMPNGNLGVQTAGSSANVVINVLNYSGAEVRKEESEGADGSRQVDVIIGDAMNRHILSGKADRALGGRYGLRAAGV